MTKIYLFVLVFIPSLAHSNESLTLKITGQPSWQLSEEARGKFVSFLELERQQLLKAAPSMDFPEAFSSLMSGITEYAMADHPNYKNRAMSCDFFNKILSRISDPSDIAFLKSLTKNGEICIPRDVPADERDQWSLSLANFLWDRPWIRNGDRLLSLQTKIIESLDLKEFTRPKISILSSTDFDGYGYNYSSHDRNVIDSNPKLRNVFDIAKNYNPNDTSTLGELGAHLKSIVDQDATGIGGLFIVGPSIHITNNWSPEALVELLTHEFGHVLHNGMQANLFDHGDTIEVAWDQHHQEAAAEATAWQVLCDVYGDYPEIEFFHVFKLKWMAQFPKKQSDPHLVGAIAFAPLFHYQCGGNREIFDDFLQAPGLGEFMTKRSSSELQFLGKKADLDILLNWK